jgi:pyruvate kinase
MLVHRHQKTKIVATLGPASSSYERLKELVKAGVDVFRLNFSHGSHEEHLEVINRILDINEKYQVHVGILADLQGPKIRIGRVVEGGIPLKAGDHIQFEVSDGSRKDEPLGNAEKVFIRYDDFAKDVSVGERVLCDDGKIIFEVVQSDEKSLVELKVIHAGVLHSNKGVNLPDTKISTPSMTEKDLRDRKLDRTIICAHG